MKKVKKIFSFLLAMTMTLAMGISAAATGSITISNADANKTYTVYKVFDATFSEAGTPAYSIKADSAWYSTISAKTDLFTLNEIPGSNPAEYSVVMKDNQDAAIRDFFKTVSVPAGAPESDQSNLAPGFYLISRNESKYNTTVTVNDSDVTVIDKNETPGFSDPDGTDGEQGNGKNVSDTAGGSFGTSTTVSMGEKAYFKVTANVPKYAEDQIVNQYVFEDELANGLTFNNDVVLKIGTTTLTKGTDYTVEVNGQKVTITLTVYGNQNYPATDSNMELTYSATANTEAVYDNTNKIEMSWTTFKPSTTDPTTPENPNPDPENPDGPDGTDSTTPTTHTYVYGFKLKKTNSSNETLTGAKFKLYDAETGGTEIQLVADGTDAYKVFTGATGETAVEAIDAGEVKIFGLKAGTYYLEETKAPDGYNPLTKREKVVLADDGTLYDTTDGKAYLKDAIAVVNNSGAELPSTGGIGTTIFYVIGSMLMIGAAVLLVTRKKMSVSND